MSEKKNRLYSTLEAAEAACSGKEQVFEVTDTGVEGRKAFVVARSHPLARSAAALAWGIGCSTAGSGRMSVEEAVEMLEGANEQALSTMSEEGREKLRELLEKMEASKRGPAPSPDGDGKAKRKAKAKA